MVKEAATTIEGEFYFFNYTVIILGKGVHIFILGSVRLWVKTRKPERKVIE